MVGVAAGGPAVWDGRGGVHPERLARRKRLANGAAAVALAIAIPTVVGSSAGWWASGSADGVMTAGEADDVVGGIDSLVSDPLGGARPEPGGQELGLVGLGAGLLDVAVDLEGGCSQEVAGEPVVVGVLAGPVDPGAVGVVGTGAEVDSVVAAGGVVVPVEVASARHLAAVVTCAGGVLGRPVEVVVAEAAGSPLATRAAVARLVERGVSFVVGPSRVEVALQAAEAVNGEVAIVSPLSVEPTLDDHGRGLFLIGPDAAALADAAAVRARDRGWRTAVLFSGSDPLEDLVAATFEGSFAARGGSVTGRLPLVTGPDGAVEVGDQLRRLGAGPVSQPPPDVIVSAAEADVLAGLRAALDAAGVEVPIIAIDRRRPAGWAIADAGVEVVGRDPAEPGGRASRLLDASATRSAVAVDDPVAAGRVVDAILVGLDAIERAGATEAEAVLASLREPGSIDGIWRSVGVWQGSGVDVPGVPIPVLGFPSGVPALVATLGPEDD